MDFGANIHNAFDVVKQTHENVKKLMEYCKSMSEEKGEYTLVSPKFLRRKSDNDSSSWCISSFIFLFQNEDDIQLENDWRDGPVYVLEINLYEPEVYSYPMVNIAKYEYNDITSWVPGVLPSAHEYIYTPLFFPSDKFDYKEDGLNYDGHVTDNQYADTKWWGLRRIVGFCAPLTDITPDNAYDKIFGGFNSLADK